MVADTRYLVTWHQVPGARNQAPAGAGYQAPGSRCLVPGAMYSAQGTVLSCLYLFYTPVMGVSRLHNEPNTKQKEVKIGSCRNPFARPPTPATAAIISVAQQTHPVPQEETTPGIRPQRGRGAHLCVTPRTGGYTPQQESRIDEDAARAYAWPRPLQRTPTI